MPSYHSTPSYDRSFRMLEDHIVQLERQNGDLQTANNIYRARYQLAEINLAIADEFISSLSVTPVKTPLHTGPIEALEAFPA